MLDRLREGKIWCDEVGQPTATCNDDHHPTHGPKVVPYASWNETTTRRWIIYCHSFSHFESDLLPAHFLIVSIISFSQMSYDYTPNNTKLDALIFSVSVEKFICFYLRSLFCQIFLLPKHSVDVIWNSRLMKATNGTQKSRSHKSAPMHRFVKVGS